MLKDIESAIKIAKEFYAVNNLNIPNSVTEYIKSYPPGLSRQVLDGSYNLKCSEFVKLINPDYQKPLNVQDRVQVEASRLNYIVLTDISTLRTSRDKVELQCIDCNYIHTTTVTSLQNSKLGCPKCKSGNLPWYKREQELKVLLHEVYDATLESDIPSSQTGYIKLKHICGTVYTTQLVGVVSPNTDNRATCPQCRDSDRRVVYESITFGSTFECECYKLLKHLDIEMHVPYAKYLNTDRKWNCDFKLGNIWIEVSNFKTDYKNYFQNIEEKRKVVESSQNQYFFFITSIKELEEVISLM